MTTIINGSSPSITFSDSTTQGSAGLPSTGGNITGNLNVSGTVGIGTTSPTQTLTLASGYVQTGNGTGAAGGVWLPYGANAGTRSWRMRTDTVAYGDLVLEQSTTQTGTSFASQFIIDPNGNTQFNSGYGSVATAYGCRAWGAFNGTNGSIYGSGGISSVTRSSTGRYILNFSFTMPDTNYATVGSVSQTSGGATPLGVFGKTYDTPSQTTTSITVYTLRSTDATLIDYPYVNFCIYR